MAENTKKSNQDRIKEITESIETGIRDLFESDRYRSYLAAMSRFHRYSVNNQILIFMQRPSATLVAGFNSWRDQFGRHVRKGEKGLQILAPVSTTKKITQAKFDPDTKAPMLDDDGNVITEEKTVRTVPNYFKPVTVFDVSQTEGKPLPELARTLTDDVEHYEAFAEALRRSSPVPIEFEDMTPTTDGFFSEKDQRIAIRTGMSEAQTVAALVHEIAHSKLHNAALATDTGKPTVKTRSTKEVEAESVAYAVCQYYGIETSENSFGYIASWSKNKELKELKASLNTITKTVSALIADVDRNLAEIRRERGLDQVQEAEEPEQAEPVPAAEPVRTEVPTKPEPSIEDSAASAAPVSEAVDPYLEYTTALMEHCNQLRSAGLISLPYPIDHDEANAYADLLRSSGPKHAQGALDDFAEQSGFPTPVGLQEKLDDLKELWNSGLTYELKDNELDKSFGFIRSYTPGGEIDDRILFSGPKIVCEMVLNKLNDRSLTPEQAKELTDRWDTILPLGPSEALYQDRRGACIHLELTETGYDYTVYDTSTGYIKSSGQIEAWAADQMNYETVIQGALSEVCVRENIHFTSCQAFPLDRLEDLRALREHPPKLDEYPMPDATVEPDALQKAGCVDPEAGLPLSRERALELFTEGYTVYMIEASGDPMMCFDEEDITGAKNQVFSVDRWEWEKSPDFRAMIHDHRIEHQAEREAAFLRYPGDAFAIYQVSEHSTQRRDRLFKDLDSLKQLGMEPAWVHYDLIYTGTIADHPAVKTPEDAFHVFNLERPCDFGGHSLSVSDIIAFRRNGVVTYHYCDSVGFEKVPDFRKPENYLKNAEMAMEDDYGMVDGIINNGPKDQGPPKPELLPERPSLRARLQKESEKAAQKNIRERQSKKERSIYYAEDHDQTHHL